MNFWVLEKSIWVLEKSWKSPGKLFLRKGTNPGELIWSFRSCDRGQTLCDQQWERSTWSIHASGWLFSMLTTRGSSCFCFALSNCLHEGALVFLQVRGSGNSDEHSWLSWLSRSISSSSALNLVSAVWQTFLQSSLSIWTQFKCSCWAWTHLLFSLYGRGADRTSLHVFCWNVKQRSVSTVW